MTDSEQFLQDLRSALNHLYDPYHLRKSPLARLFNLGNQPDTPAALQRILNEAIEALEPRPGEPNLAQRQRIYDLITYRYVQQFSQEEVANQLGLSVRHLRREQNAAIFALGASLWERYRLGSRPLERGALEGAAWTEPAEGEAAEALPGGETTPGASPAAGVEPASAGGHTPGGGLAPGSGLAPGGVPTPGADAGLGAETGAGAETAPAADAQHPPGDLEWLRSAPLEEPADLALVLGSVLELSWPLAERRQVRIHLRAGAGVGERGAADADEAGEGILLAVQPVALRQMLLNLLTVAIPRHAGGALAIGVRAGAAGESVTITVEAEGPGAVPPDGAVPPPTADELSTLEIARRMAEISGGRLALAPGPALRAVLTLPALRTLRVLVIDDNADFIQMVERFLCAAGADASAAGGQPAWLRCRVAGENDPARAVEAAVQHQPDVILLDVMMPRIDGWEVLGRLRRHPNTAHIPIIVCTILAQEELALSLGARAFLRKPITPERLQAALEDCLTKGPYEI